VNICVILFLTFSSILFLALFVTFWACVCLCCFYTSSHFRCFRFFSRFWSFPIGLLLWFVCFFFSGSAPSAFCVARFVNFSLCSFVE
jgi:hypothetical protein